jgi:Protein of unknown function, DUF269.
MTPTVSVATSPFLQAIVAQIRAQDPYGIYRSWSDERLLQPYILSKEEKRQIPLDRPVEEPPKPEFTSFTVRWPA